MMHNQAIKSKNFSLQVKASGINQGHQPYTKRKTDTIHGKMGLFLKLPGPAREPPDDDRGNGEHSRGDGVLKNTPKHFRLFFQEDFQRDDVQELPHQPCQHDNSGTAHLDDAIIVLQMVNGMFLKTFTLAADVNADSRIGIEEAAYILQREAGVR